VSEPAPIVFVVDDDDSVRMSLRRLLTSAGFNVEVFPTARAFLSSPRPDAPACLVLDVRLPDLNGLALQKHLSQAGVSLPIVFLTGHGDIPMTVQAMKAGAVEFLTKPFRPDELLKAIRHALDSARRIREEGNEDPSKVG
jgi:FixJ family two-component response regulator